MKNKLLSLVLIIEIFSLFIIDKPQKNNNKNFNYFVKSVLINDINESKLENYIIGVVAAEMPASFSLEALKSQAVAARTFTYKKVIENNIDYDTLASDKGQGYITLEQMKNNWKDDFPRNYKIIKDAVLSTKGEIITYDNKPINAYYFSMSNGNTEDSKMVFGEEPYLSVVDSSWDKEISNFSVEKRITSKEFKQKLGLKCENIIIDSIKRTSTNHVEEINICDNTYSGIEFRKKLDLRSTDFDLETDKDHILITTRGYGHGVGMSQYGANYLAQEGKTYKEIIGYYYNNVSIKKIV